MWPRDRWFRNNLFAGCRGPERGYPHLAMQVLFETQLEIRLKEDNIEGTDWSIRDPGVPVRVMVEAIRRADADIQEHFRQYRANDYHLVNRWALAYIEDTASPTELQWFHERKSIRPREGVRRNPFLVERGRPQATPEEVEVKEAKVLDVDSLPDLRDGNRPPFQLRYENIDEVNLRLRNSVIGIKGHPFLVRESYQKRGLFGGQMILRVEDASNDVFDVPLNKATDFRSVEPGYVTCNKTTCHLRRLPARVYQQGLNRENTKLVTVGKAKDVQFHQRDLLIPLKNRKLQIWSEKVLELIRDGIIQDMRLSNTIAVYAAKSGVLVEYKGRTFGVIQEDTVKVKDEDDLLPPWIAKEFRAVELKLSE